MHEENTKETQLNIFSHIICGLRPHMSNYIIRYLLFLHVCFFFWQRTSAGAVELSDIKQMKTPPPLPPKPGHGLLKSQLAAVDGTIE